jgi:cation diffusion facilitator family transporter
MAKSSHKIRAIRISLYISVILMAVKFSAYLLTHSNAILTDAMESIVNVTAGAFALFSIWYASLPRDENHPYGHGKIEFFSAGFEGGLIFIAAILVIINATTALFKGNQIHSLDTGMIMTAIAGGINYFTGRFLVREGNRNNSLLMVASGKHLLSDTLTSIGLIAGLAIVWFTNLLWIDSIIAIIFGIIILRTGYNLIRKSVTGLLDEADMKKLELIINEMDTHRREKWIDIHNLRVLKFGSKLHVDCHITLPWYESLEKTHDEIVMLENLVRKNSGHDVEFFIHADPCVMPHSCRVCQVQECKYRQAEFVKKIQWNTENLLPNKRHSFQDQ